MPKKFYLCSKLHPIHILVVIEVDSYKKALDGGTCWGAVASSHKTKRDHTGPFVQSWVVAGNEQLYVGGQAVQGLL